MEIALCTLLGAYCLSSRFSSFKQFFTKVSESLESYMVKFFLYPSSTSISLRKNLAQNAWNVFSQTSFALLPIMRSTRSRISAAALFVNVIAKILYGATPSSNKLAIRQVNTFVFPEPAPAIISSGPFVCFTASICAGFNPSNISISPSNYYYPIRI